MPAVTDAGGGDAVPSPPPAVATGLTWPQVLAAVDRRRLGTIPLSLVCDDSREVRPGAIFVAHRGVRLDGHAFIGDAQARGAALIVAEHPVPGPIPCCVVADGRKAVSALAAAWFGHPDQRLRLVGITGTNGKTTTAHLTAAVLAAAGLKAGVAGTLGLQHRPGEISPPLPWTTPPAVALHRWLAAEVRAGSDACVVEVSAQALSQRRVHDCAFDVGAITNLAREHGEFYASADAYAAAKAGLFRRLGALGKPAWAVRPAVLPYPDLFEAASTVPCLRFGPGGEVRALEVRPRGLAGTDLRIALPACSEGVTVALRLPGAHNVENALCAAAVGAALGIDPPVIAAGLEAVAAVPGRLQAVAAGGVRVLVDYAHNPAGLRALLRLLRAETPGRLVVVMGARGQRDRGKRFTMGCVAAAFADLIVLTSDRPAGEDPEEAYELMRMAVTDCGVPVIGFPDRYTALEVAMRGREAGDCVVAVGKGEEAWEGDSVHRDLNDVRALAAICAGADGA